MAKLTNSKLHKVLILFCQHVQEELSDLEQSQRFHVGWIVGKVGQVCQHLLFSLCQEVKRQIRQFSDTFIIKTSVNNYYMY